MTCMASPGSGVGSQQHIHIILWSVIKVMLNSLCGKGKYLVYYFSRVFVFNFKIKIKSNHTGA